MATGLSASERARFAEQGYLSGLPLLGAAECAELLGRIERFEAERPGDAAWAFDIKANLLFDWVHALATHPRVLDVVEDLLGPDLFVTDTVFRIKEPGGPTRYGWHQDGARITLDPMFVIAYVSLTASTRANGCLRVIPGSHGRVHPFELVSNSNGQARRRVARTLDVDESRAVDLALGPGEMAIFDGNVVHGSGPNRSRGRRVAILTDYTAAHARQSTGRSSGQLARGEDRLGLIAHEPVPTGTCTAHDAAERRRVLTTWPENVLMGPLAPGESPDFPDANVHHSPGQGRAQ